MNKFIAILIGAGLLAVATVSPAQVMLRKAVVASGGTLATNGTTAGGMTVGQAVQGTASNGQTVGRFGFWSTALAASSSSVSSAPAMSVSIQEWPNPTDGTATARITLTSAGALELGLYDVTGKEVRAISSGAHTSGTFDVPLDLSGLPNGRYILAARLPGQLVEQPISIVK